MLLSHADTVIKFMFTYSKCSQNMGCKGFRNALQQDNQKTSLKLSKAISTDIKIGLSHIWFFVCFH